MMAPRPESRSSRSAGTRRFRRTPQLEGLERRELLYATLGGSFANTARITYSFVPDGTSIGGISSNLYATLNAIAPTATWQNAFRRAAAMWSSYANINLAEVSDNGAPLGAPGNQQGDPNFGDIRISMTPQSGGVLGTAFLPPNFNGASAAGDISLNSNIAWAINGNYDLQTVAMHEMGHALGLDHTTLTAAAMYPYYNNVKQTLTADDIAGIQSIYGAYPADSVDDGSFAKALDLTPLLTSNGQVALGGRSLAGGSDLDFYKIVVPSNTTGTMVVTMQSTQLSSVSPRFSVFNGSYGGIAGVSAANSMGATITASITGVTPGQTFYIRASAASGYGAFGAYGILVNFGSSSQPPIAPPNTAIAAQPDQGAGSINQEFVQLGDFIGVGETYGGPPPPLDASSRLDPGGWSIYLDSLGFLDPEIVNKATKLLNQSTSTSWDSVVDAVLDSWGNDEAILYFVKQVTKPKKS